MNDKISVLAVPKLIGKRTKEGDRVFDGVAVFSVMNRAGDMLILCPESSTDYHFYVREIGGGARRYNDYDSALEAVGLPATAAQLDAALETTQAMLRAKAGVA
jgi:hypothetical protein